jgi:hypothetical protein
MQALITERDVAVLVDVYKYRYLSVSQIEALHFPSLQTAYRRLRALTAGNYLKSFTVPGIPERVFYLDKSGAEVVAGEMLVEQDALKWHRVSQSPKDYRFLRHFLAINDFRISLTLACQQNPITLLGFIPEYIGEKTTGGYVKSICAIMSVMFAGTLSNFPIHQTARSLLKKTVRPPSSSWRLTGGTRWSVIQTKGY